MIYAGTVRRKLWDFLVFEDIGKFGIFEGDRRRRSGADYGYGIRNGNSVGVEMGIEVNCGGKGFFVTGNVGDREQK